MSRSSVSTLTCQYPGRPADPGDVYAPCPPTPHFVEQDEVLWSSLPSPWPDAESPAAVSGPPSSTSKLSHPTSFANLPTNQPQDHVPGHDIKYPTQCRETYACPSPVLMIIQRATLDRTGFRQTPVIPTTCVNPGVLFSRTGGLPSKTGIDVIDKDSARYYAKRPLPSLFRNPDYIFAYYYPINCIKAVQRSLRMDWSFVYPGPIPAVIVRSSDFVGPFTLEPGVDGFGYVQPTWESIWKTIRKRGIDSRYRPMDQSVVVETGPCRLGTAHHFPQHIVAANFAVNMFLEIDDPVTTTNTHCEYLGAYVMQVVDEQTTNRAAWLKLHPYVRRFLSRLPEDYELIKHPSHGWPILPHVRFWFYKWDPYIVGLADEILMHNNLVESYPEESESDGAIDDSDCDHNTERDAGGGPNVH